MYAYVELKCYRRVKDRRLVAVVHVVVEHHGDAVKTNTAQFIIAGRRCTIFMISIFIMFSFYRTAKSFIEFNRRV